MKNEKIEMPQVEVKVLQKFRVVRQAVIEFEFEVLAESRYDAEQIVEDSTSLSDYCDTYGADYEEGEYDSNGYARKIEGVQTGSGWWNHESMFVEEIRDETKSIYKMQDDEWENTDNVFETEEDCIEAWKEEHEIYEDDNEDEDK